MATVPWRTSTDTQRRFRELLAQLQDMTAHDPAHLQLLDDIRSLPGFPHLADIDRDIITLVNTTERSH